MNRRSVDTTILIIDVISMSESSFIDHRFIESSSSDYDPRRRRPVAERGDNARERLFEAGARPRRAERDPDAARVESPAANSPEALRMTPRARACATNASDDHRCGRCSQRCGLEGCVCRRSPSSRRRAIAWRAAVSCRFHSAMRAAVPSSIQPQSRSAPIGDGMIIVAQIAARDLLDQRRRRHGAAEPQPGKEALRQAGDEDRPCGNQRRERHALRREEPVGVVLDRP